MSTVHPLISNCYQKSSSSLCTHVFVHLFVSVQSPIGLSSETLKHFHKLVTTFLSIYFFMLIHINSVSYLLIYIPFVCQSTRPSIHPLTHTLIDPATSLYIYPSIHLFLRPSIAVSPFVHPSLYLFILPSIQSSTDSAIQSTTLSSIVG